MLKQVLLEGGKLRTCWDSAGGSARLTKGSLHPPARLRYLAVMQMAGTALGQWPGVTGSPGDTAVPPQV